MVRAGNLPLRREEGTAKTPMNHQSPNRLGDLFPRVDVLAGPVRLLLSELLTPPGTAPALLPDDIADLPVPAAIEARSALRAAIEKGLTSDALDMLRTLPLSEVVPPISTCEGGPVLAGCPVRLSDLLAREGATTWSRLKGLKLSDMAQWTNMGPRSQASLIGAAVEAAFIPGPAPEAGAAEEGLAPDDLASALALLLHHEQLHGGDLRRALEARASGEGPTEVGLAAARLLAAADRAGDPRLALLDKVWRSAGDHRARGVLAYRALTLGRRAAVKDVAAALGLSENRVVQIQVRAERLAHEAADVAGPALEPLVLGLRSRLGTTTHLDAVDDALTDLGLPSHHDTRSALLVWLAGPFMAVGHEPGWIATDPAAVLAATRRHIHEDGGVRSIEHLAADLEAAGIAPDDVGGWLGTQPVIVVEGLIVALAGSPADVAERILSATGRAMAPDELAAMTPRSQAPTALHGRLRRDSRFIQVDRDRFELAEWGGEASTGSAPPEPAEMFPGAGRSRTETGRSQLRIKVDAGVLRGTSEPIPFSVVEALGLRSGGRRTFTTRFGPVALNHKAAQPTRGSVRPVALAVGAREGDALLLEFDAATGDASVELVVASRSAAS